MIRAGHLGVKTGRGLFEYDEEGQMKAQEPGP
jgi:3-hydroxyacyl-CoA dehydrogenase